MNSTTTAPITKPLTHQGMDIYTRETFDGYEHRISVLVPNRWDDLEPIGFEPIGWITKFSDERKWTLVYKGENTGSTAKKTGLDWLIKAAHRDIMSR